MGREIECKFLVANEGWRAAASGSSRLRDGLIARFGTGKTAFGSTGTAACSP